jgi:hypothetical protein
MAVVLSAHAVAPLLEISEQLAAVRDRGAVVVRGIERYAVHAAIKVILAPAQGDRTTPGFRSSALVLKVESIPHASARGTRIALLHSFVR